MKLNDELPSQNAIEQQLAQSPRIEDIFKKLSPTLTENATLPLIEAYATEEH